MMRFKRKSPEIVDAITFDELVDHGLNCCGLNQVNGMPWSFDYMGQPITHETDTCYLVPVTEGTACFTPNDMLVNNEQGLVIYSIDYFRANYDAL